MMECKAHYVNDFQVYYIFYLYMLEKYDNFTSMNVLDREKLLRLRNISVRSREDFENSLRAYYNFKVIIQEKEESYVDNFKQLTKDFKLVV